MFLRTNKSDSNIQAKLASRLENSTVFAVTALAIFDSIPDINKPIVNLLSSPVSTYITQYSQALGQGGGGGGGIMFNTVYYESKLPVIEASDEDRFQCCLYHIYLGVLQHVSLQLLFVPHCGDIEDSVLSEICSNSTAAAIPSPAQKRAT
ncbi:hypothetical protein PoB_006142900 [Plakobranchus ocellatus]|uniref:Uncharacterized protein n=1 Tax=Plakobranchus ocellatus TaxID=259542 RepID=A0AAV4CSQ9_9GAST|nr:hypothetical protein PoB_006142900 [Plakobranchus ocellatus]